MTEVFELEEKKQKGLELFQRGRQARIDNKPEEAVRCLREAMILLDECGVYDQYTRCINMLGITYAGIGNDTMAADCYLDGLEYVRLYRLKGLAHMFYNNIGTRYQELGNWEKALEYYLMAKENMEEYGMKNFDPKNGWVLVTYLNLGLVYFYLNNNELSKHYLALSKKEEELGSNVDYEFSILVMQCKLSYRRGDKVFAKSCLPRLLELVKICELTLGDYHQDVSELIRLLTEMKDYENWKYVLEENDHIVNERQVMFYILSAKGFWADYYKAIGDEEAYKQACIDYASLFKKAKESEDKEKAAALNLKLDLQKAEIEIKQAEQKSERDVLTGLGNRYALQKQGYKMLRQMPDQKTLFAVGMLDLDCFKLVNDTYGHMQGDYALKQVADIFFDCFDGYGEVYRYGGDEYIALIPQCTPDRKSVV